MRSKAMDRHSSTGVSLFFEEASDMSIDATDNSQGGMREGAIGAILRTFMSASSNNSRTRKQKGTARGGLPSRKVAKTLLEKTLYVGCSRSYRS